MLSFERNFIMRFNVVLFNGIIKSSEQGAFARSNVNYLRTEILIKITKNRVMLGEVRI